MEIIRSLHRLIRDLFRHRKELATFLLVMLVCLVVFGLMLKVFAELTEEVLAKQMVWFDDHVAGLVLPHRTDSLTGLMVAVTNFGGRLVYGFITVLVAALLYWRNRIWTDSAEVVTVLFSAGITNRVLKNFFAIERPDRLYHLVEATSPSFPSGHAMGSMAFYGFLIYLCWRYVPGLAWRALVTLLLGLLILFIGLSRIYLGVHYASDVLAGFVAGLLWLSLCIMIFRSVRFFWRRRARLRKEHPADPA